jgi:hypothetical protein
MRCTLDNDQIRPRTRDLTRLLRPLIPPSRQLFCYPRYLDRELILSLYIDEQPTSTNPDEWRFPTRISTIRASYYEKWKPTDERRKLFFLHQAYLHLFLRKSSGTEQQILAVHCDPNSSETDKHFQYKAGPHVHMSAAESPLHKAHVALNNGNLKTVLASAAALTAALSLAIAMVDNQVLSLYQ